MYVNPQGEKSGSANPKASVKISKALISIDSSP